MGCCGRCLDSKITKTILRLCFSHIGLFFIVIIYTVIGALIFQAIEGGDEKTRRQVVLDCHTNVNAARQMFRDKIIYIAKNNVTTDPAEGKSFIKKQLDLFHKVMKEAIYNTTNQSDHIWPMYQPMYSGNVDLPDATLRWNLPSAMLFTATILTTIGYGHVYPITQTGYMVFLIYSVFAIPLMSMFLMSVSTMLTHGIKVAYHNGCCFFIEKKRRRMHENVPLRRPNAVSSETSARPRSAWDESNPSKTTTDERVNEFGENEAEVELTQEEEDEKYDADIVPASLSAFLVVLYLIMVTFVYHAWEDWSLVTSAYFGVVTLMTIGFGDYVPGLIPTDRAYLRVGEIEISLASIFIIIGLAILSMGISLIMSAISLKMREVAMKIEDKTGWDVIDGYEGKPKEKKDEVEPFVHDEAVKA